MVDGTLEHVLKVRGRLPRVAKGYRTGSRTQQRRAASTIAAAATSATTSIADANTNIAERCLVCSAAQVPLRCSYAGGSCIAAIALRGTPRLHLPLSACFTRRPPSARRNRAAGTPCMCAVAAPSFPSSFFFRAVGLPCGHHEHAIMASAHYIGFSTLSWLQHTVMRTPS